MQDNEITIDIETIPNEQERLVASVIDKVSPPKTMSKPETIDKWWKESGEQAKQDAIHAMGLKAGLGKIVCIGLTVGDGEAQSFTGDEDFILSNLNSVMTDVFNKTRKSPFFIGHNLSGFDLRYIWQRMVILGSRPSFQLPHNDASWKGTYFDTMTEWAGRDRVSLDDLCLYLGIESPKSECDGSKVWDFYKEGRIDEIAEYCRGDVLATRECYKKMTFQ